MVYEDSKKVVSKVIHNQVLSDLTAGAIAGAVSVFANNPIDVVKT